MAAFKLWFEELISVKELIIRSSNKVNFVYKEMKGLFGEEIGA